MLLSAPTDPQSPVHYEPPAWARACYDEHASRATEPLDLRDIDRWEEPDASELMVEHPPRESAASRLTGLLCYGLAAWALVWFGGHVVAAWIAGRL